MSGDSLASLNQLGLKVRKQNKTFDAYAIAQLWQKQVFGALTITLAHADMKLVINEWKDWHTVMLHLHFLHVT